MSNIRNFIFTFVSIQFDVMKAYGRSWFNKYITTTEPNNNIDL